ncbi:MAG: 1-acyl-sn-glycerol-3-phosphate acyltransferase, partial [Planctomycetota bacterium]
MVKPNLETIHRPLWKRLWYQLTQLVAGLYFRVWFRLRREGHRRPPMTGPMVLVANHASHLDPVLVGVMLPRQICYLARETLFRGPL